MKYAITALLVSTLMVWPATGQLANVATTSPNPTEITYLDGATSSIQNQINNLYSFLVLGFASTNPAQNTSRYAGAMLGLAMQTTETNYNFIPPIISARVIKTATLRIDITGTLGTAAQTVTHFIGVAGSYTPVWTNDMSLHDSAITVTNLSITINPGDLLVWKMTFPTIWTTPAAAVNGAMILGIK